MQAEASGRGGGPGFRAVRIGLAVAQNVAGGVELMHGVAAVVVAVPGFRIRVVEGQIARRSDRLDRRDAAVRVEVLHRGDPVVDQIVALAVMVRDVLLPGAKAVVPVARRIREQAG